MMGSGIFCGNLTFWQLSIKYLLSGGNWVIMDPGLYKCKIKKDNVSCPQAYSHSGRHYSPVRYVACQFRNFWLALAFRCSNLDSLHAWFVCLWLLSGSPSSGRAFGAQFPSFLFITGHLSINETHCIGIQAKNMVLLKGMSRTLRLNPYLWQRKCFNSYTPFWLMTRFLPLAWHVISSSVLPWDVDM